MSGKKVLITLSDAEYFSLKKSSGNIVQQASGFFVMELANPLDRLLKAGYEVTFSSPGGRASTPDPNSESLAAFAGSFYGRQRENDLLERMKPNNDFNSPRRFADISDEECQNFVGVFIPGGHAPLADLGDNSELGRIISQFPRIRSQRRPSAMDRTHASRRSIGQKRGLPTRGTRSPAGRTRRRSLWRRQCSVGKSRKLRRRFGKTGRIWEKT